MQQFAPLEISLYGRVKRQIFDPDLIELEILMRGQAELDPNEDEWLACEMRIECIARFWDGEEC